jgi:hypothetical protein
MPRCVCTLTHPNSIKFTKHNYVPTDATPLPCIKEARASFNRAAVLINPTITSVLKELIAQVSTRIVDLDAIISRRDSILSGMKMITHPLLDFRLRQLPSLGQLGVQRIRTVRSKWYRTGADDLIAFHFRDLRDRSASQCLQLQANEWLFLVSCIGHGFSGGDLFIAPNSGNVGVAACVL